MLQRLRLLLHHSTAPPTRRGALAATVVLAVAAAALSLVLLPPPPACRKLPAAGRCPLAARLPFFFAAPASADTRIDRKERHRQQRGETMAPAPAGAGAGAAAAAAVGDCAEPPVAARRPREVEVEFEAEPLVDPYAWLRDDSRSRPEVLAHLEAENAHAASHFQRLAPLVDALAADADARLPPVEVSQPELKGRWAYYRRRGPGDEYWTLLRRPLPRGAASAAEAAAAAAAAAAADASGGDGGSSAGGGAGAEQVVLDENALAEGSDYWDVPEAAVSPDGARVAYTFDVTGDERFSLQVLDVETGRPLLEQPLAGCAGSVMWWGNSSTTLLYTAEDGSPDRSGTLLMALALQDGPPRPPRPSLLYRPQQGEHGLEARLSRDGQFVILTSSVDGAARVQALPTSHPLRLGGDDGGGGEDLQEQEQKRGRGREDGDDDERLAAPSSAWLQVIRPEDDLDVLSCDHLGAAPAAAGVAAAGAGGGAGAPGAFVAIVDDDAAPDGEVVLVTLAAQRGPADNSGAGGARPGGSKRTMEVLVRNRRAEGPSDSGGGGSGDEEGDSGDDHSGTSSGARGDSSSSSSSAGRRMHQADGANGATGELPHKQQQQPQQPPRSLEINEFRTHSEAGLLAVGVRRGGVCSVEVFRLAPAEEGGGGGGGGGGGPTPAARRVVLRTRGARGEGAAGAPADTGAAGGAAPAPPAAGGSGGGGALAARPAWVVELDDPTLLCEVEALVGPPHDPWLALHVSGIVAPSALYYVSMAQPQRQEKVYEERILRFDRGAYEARLEWAPSAGGALVPVTLAYRADLMRRDGSNPAIMHGYGAYGSKQWPHFNPADLALLDRGAVVAVAHVRGGGELGSGWHVGGKRFRKKNTFRDFLAAARHLVGRGYTSHERLAAWGRSAGGLTVGASLNLDPGFARAAVLDVPFLDPLGTMRDPSLPLTVKERSEWGDPLNNEAAYRYIRSYSPYSNLRPPGGRYPSLLLTASLHDTRVNFWEPAKFAAALRHLKAEGRAPGGGCAGAGAAGGAGGERPLLLLTDMHAGHFAASAASSRLRERAQKVAFLLDCLGAGSDGGEQEAQGGGGGGGR